MARRYRCPLWITPITDARPAARPLTSGERALTAALFGSAVDPDPVQVFNSCWWPLQPRRTVMAPDGHVWCHPRGSAWRADWSAGQVHEQAFFLHEMTHVWQWQSGVCVWLARPPFARYRYRLVPGKPLTAYGLEQQAEIVRHAWLARCGDRKHADVEWLCRQTFPSSVT